MPNASSTLSVVEIIRSITAHKPAPFLCKCTDGRLYIVKGPSGSAFDALIAEWVAASLAKQFGLSVPPFYIVDVSGELTEFMPEWRAHLPEGKAFASLFIENATPISVHQAHNAVSVQTQKLIYLFDYWINNAARSSTANHTDMVYDYQTGRHYLINHEQAFSWRGNDETASTHIYASKNRQWVFDLVDRQEGDQRTAKIIQSLDSFISELPHAWVANSSVYIDQIKCGLQHVSNNEFWSKLS